MHKTYQFRNDVLPLYRGVVVRFDLLDQINITENKKKTKKNVVDINCEIFSGGGVPPRERHRHELKAKLKLPEGPVGGCCRFTIIVLVVFSHARTHARTHSDSNFVIEAFADAHV